jgi:hypothetical protein
MPAFLNHISQFGYTPTAKAVNNKVRCSDPNDFVRP